MALSREEAINIGKEAATKVPKPLKDKCLKIAWPFELIRVNFIDEALTHSGQGLLAKETKQELGIESAIANTRFFIESARKYIEEDLYKEDIITSEEMEILDKELKEIQALVSTEKFGEARDKIAETDSNLWEMMLEKAVACECQTKK